MTGTATVVPEQPAVAPRFVSQLKGTNVILEGQRAHFECRIEPQNDPNLRVQWMLNGSEVKASSRIQTYNDFGYVAIDILDATKAWLPDGYGQNYRSCVFGPSGLQDYGSATLRCKI